MYYAAATAAKLGYSVGVVTAGAAEVGALRALPNTVVVSLDTKKSTSFENVYDASGRRQYLRALAEAIPPDMVPSEWCSAPAALMAPVAGEVPFGMIRMFPRALIGLSPQGWMRELVVGQEVRFKAWHRAREVLDQAATAIFSDEDLRGHSADWLGYCGPVLVRTRGRSGCDLIHCRRERYVAGFPADEVDPTGAGDVFAAAYTLKLAETREPLEAARFANCVASFSVTGHGIETLPSGEQVQQRLAQAVLSLRISPCAQDERLGEGAS